MKFRRITLAALMLCETALATSAMAEQVATPESVASDWLSAWTARDLRRFDTHIAEEDREQFHSWFRSIDVETYELMGSQLDDARAVVRFSWECEFDGEAFVAEFFDEAPKTLEFRRSLEVEMTPKVVATKRYVEESTHALTLVNTGREWLVDAVFDANELDRIWDQRDDGCNAEFRYPPRPAEGRFVLDAAELTTHADSVAIELRCRSLALHGVSLFIVTLPSLEEYGASGWNGKSYGKCLMEAWGIPTNASVSLAFVVLALDVEKKLSVEIHCDAAACDAALELMARMNDAAKGFPSDRSQKLRMVAEWFAKHVPDTLDSK